VKGKESGKGKKVFQGKNVVKGEWGGGRCTLCMAERRCLFVNKGEKEGGVRPLETAQVRGGNVRETKPSFPGKTKRKRTQKKKKYEKGKSNSTVRGGEVVVRTPMPRSGVDKEGVYRGLHTCVETGGEKKGKGSPVK